MYPLWGIDAIPPRFTCTVINFTDFNDVYIRTPIMVQVYEDLLECLKNFYIRSGRGVRVTLNRVTEHMYCAVIVGGSVYRGIIRQTSWDGYSNIELVDEAREVFVELVNIFYLHEHFHLTPILNTPCSVFGLNHLNYSHRAEEFYFYISVRVVAAEAVYGDDITVRLRDVNGRDVARDCLDGYELEEVEEEEDDEGFHSA